MHLHCSESTIRILFSINQMVSRQTNGIICRSSNWLIHVECAMLFLQKCLYFAVCQNTSWGNWRHYRNSFEWCYTELTLSAFLGNLFKNGVKHHFWVWFKFGFISFNRDLNKINWNILNVCTCLYPVSYLQFRHCHCFSLFKITKLICGFGVVVIIGGTKHPAQHENSVLAVASGHRVPQLSHVPLTVDMLQQYSFPSFAVWHLRTFWSVHTDVSWNY